MSNLSLEEKIGKVLSNLLDEQCIHKKTFAEYYGVSPYRITQITNGKFSSINTLNKICIVLEIPLSTYMQKVEELT